VKAVACEPASQGAPLSRRSCADIHRLVVERGICQVSAPTIARWLREDAIKPWRHRSWIFPTDPDFLTKATPVLDLYQGRFEGRLLHPGDLVISADEKPSIQARARIHPTRFRQAPATASASSTATSAAAPSPTSLPGTCVAARCSAAQSRGAASRRSTGSSGRS
jgi:hypothetical protein